MTKRIAAITMARNDEFFLSRWIEYYGKNFGKENLYVYLDGLNQKIPSNADDTNIEKLEHTELTRVSGDKFRIKLLNDLSKKLFADGYDIVIGCDADELLILDPDIKTSLSDYLSNIRNKTSVSGLGIDVIQNICDEGKLDESKPLLAQRDFAVLSTRYTKPVVLFKPARWGSGFHSIKGKNFHIDKNLYFFHFGNADFEKIKNKICARNPDWANHIKRRIKTVGEKTKIKSEKFIKLSRFMQTLLRPVYAPFKPAMFGLKWIVKIPNRFKKLGV